MDGNDTTQLARPIRDPWSAFESLLDTQIVPLPVSGHRENRFYRH